MTKARERALEECIRQLRAALEEYADPNEGWAKIEHAIVFEDSRDLVPDAELLQWQQREAQKGQKRDARKQI